MPDPHTPKPLPQQGWRVRQRGHKETIVFFNASMTIEEVKHALEHDGYDKHRVIVGRIKQ